MVTMVKWDKHKNLRAPYKVLPSIAENVNYILTNNTTMADFKCGVTFNTHGNTNRSVYPSPSTQSKMLTSRPTQMLAMVLHFEDVCPAQSNYVCHSKEQQHAGKVILN